MKKNKYILFANDAIIKFKITAAELSNNLSDKLLKRACRLAENKNGFGMNEVLGIAVAIIVAAFVIIPGLKGFAESVMSNLENWWSSTAAKVFLNK
jgi:hypothetical protein